MGLACYGGGLLVSWLGFPPGMWGRVAIFAGASGPSRPDPRAKAGPNSGGSPPPPALYPRLTSRMAATDTATAIYPAPPRPRVPYPFTPVFLGSRHGGPTFSPRSGLGGGGSPRGTRNPPTTPHRALTAPHSTLSTLRGPDADPKDPLRSPRESELQIGLPRLPSATATVGAGVGESGDLAETRANSMAGGGFSFRHPAPECRAGALSAPS